MNNLYTYLICLIFFYGCTVPKKNEGTYCSYGKWIVVTLKKDNTYSYTKGVGWQHTHSEGVWSIVDANKLLLKSKFVDKKIQFSVSENFDEAMKDSFKFRLNISGFNVEKPFYSLMLCFDSGDTLIQRCDSNFSVIKKVKAKKVSIKLIADEQLLVAQNRDTLIGSDYYFLNTQNNVFDVHFNLNSALFNFVILNDTITLKKKTIYFKSDKLTRSQ